MDDYELPDVEAITAEILKDLVGPDQIGTQRRKAFDRYESMLNSTKEYRLEDFDYILLKRRQGYLTDAMTDISGMEIRCIGKDRSRAMHLMDAVTKRMLGSEGEDFLGFLIDFCTVLSGPEEESTRLEDDLEIEKGFELHIRVKWKD